MQDRAANEHGLLEVRQATVRIGGIVAIADVDLDVGDGEICGLIGPNGAGKTTLFDVISGVRAPTSGTVHFVGDDVTSRSSTQLARQGVRRTFQQPQVFGWLSVADNVLTALDWRGGAGGPAADLAGWRGRRRLERERRDLVTQTLEDCGLAEVADVSAGSLPVGLVRMVELARAIVDRPRLLLLDEPTSGLDHREAQRLADRVRQCRDQTGCAVLLVEHDVPFVMELCERIVVLDIGRVLAVGTPAEIHGNEQVQRAYLGAAPDEVTEVVV